jgi:NEDD8-activating enzyme E1 regulatory subunit
LHISAQDLTSPDSLVPLYIAFLAFDEYVATHDKDALGGVPRVPGENYIHMEWDTEKMMGISFKYVDDLVTEAGRSLDDDYYSTVKTRSGEFVQEL